MKFKLIYCVVIFFLGIQNQYSQKKWNLEECINYAYKNNLNFQNQNYDYEIQKESYKQSKRSFLPRINANSGYSINYGRSIDPDTNGYTNTSFFSNSYGLSASLDLFAGFRKWNTIFYENYQEKAMEQSLLKVKNVLKIKVLENFHEVLYTKELLKITQEQLAISKINVKIIDTKISLGLKAKSDLYEAKSILLSDSLEVLKAKNAVIATKQKLIHTMNLPEKTILLQEPFNSQKKNEFVLADSKLLLDKNLAKMPSVKESLFLVKAAKKQLTISRSFLLPSLSLNTGYNTRYFEDRKDRIGNTVGFNQQLNDNASKYVSASLNIPIFSGLQKRHQIKVSKINVLKAKNKLAQKKQQLQQEIEAAIQKSEALFLEKKMTKKSVEAKEVTFIIAQKKFKNGLITLYELSQSKKEFIQAKVTLLNTSIQLISTNWLLNYYQKNTLQ